MEQNNEQFNSIEEEQVYPSKTVRGTNGKTFSIKINVNAKDAAA